jgi:uncharacterized protein (TIRG00374 family)
MNKNYRYLILSIVVTIVGFGIWIAYEEQRDIFNAVNLVGIDGFLFLCCFSLINYGLRYIRWAWLLGQLGDRCEKTDGLFCYISGYALTTTPAKAGETIRCLYLNQRHGFHYGHTLAGILTERTTDALASMLIAVFALYSFEEMRWVGASFTIFILAIIGLVAMPRVLIRITSWFRFIKIDLFQRLLDLIPVFLERSASLFSPKPFIGGTLIAFVAWSAEAFAFAWLARTLGGDASVFLYMSIFAIAMVAGALTFMPGGLGGAELVLFLLLKATGMADAEAVAATLLCRLATLWFAVGLGLLSILWLELHPRKHQLVEKQHEA